MTIATNNSNELFEMERALDDVLAEGFHKIYPEENWDGDCSTYKAVKSARDLIRKFKETEDEKQSIIDRQRYIDSFKFRAVRCGEGVPAWDIMMELHDGTDRNMGMVSNFPMEKSWVCTLRADEANNEVEIRHASRNDMFKAIRETIADREDYAAQWEGEKDAYIYEQKAELAALRYAEERYDNLGGYDCPVEAGYEAAF